MTKRARGFTLIELVVTVTLMAVLMALVAPSFQNASVSSKVSDNASRLASSASLARGEAIKRNGLVVLCKSADGASCITTGGWEQGWIVFHDVNRDGVKDAGEALLLQEGAAPSGYKITEGGGNSSLIFQPTSIGTTIATWTVCRATPSVSSQQRQVDVSATGRSSVRKVTASACA